MNRRNLILLLSVALNVILLWALIWGGNGIVAFRYLDQQKRELAGRIDDLKERNLALSKEIRQLQSDDKYIEQTIRNRMNFVKDNEILYIFPDKPEADGTLNEPED